MSYSLDDFVSINPDTPNVNTFFQKIGKSFLVFPWEEGGAILEKKGRGIEMKDLIELRREFHRYPESGWTEFRTTVRIIEELHSLGIPVRWGREIHDPERMLGLPEEGVLEACWQRALEATGRPDLLAPMRGGFSG